MSAHQTVYRKKKMIQVQITDVKNFMNALLAADTFDPFLFVEASIRMGVSYHIDGRLNKDFYDSDLKISREFCLWKEIRQHIFSIIKGKRLPLAMKIVLALPESASRSLIESSGGPLRAEDIQGMYLNILFSPDHLSLTTGLSARTFTMDRTLEHAFDDFTARFLKERQLA